jgi:hypothetical protein
MEPMTPRSAQPPTLAVMLLLFCGCSRENVSPIAPIAPITTKAQLAKAQLALTDQEKIQLLRDEARKREMKWTIWCVRWSSQDTFQAEAWRKGESRAHDLNWQYHDRWMKVGPTQADAAYLLYLAIQVEPTHPAQTREQIAASKPENKMKLCPPELRSEP